jgi:hypothetical protein
MCQKPNISDPKESPPLMSRSAQNKGMNDIHHMLMKYLWVICLFHHLNWLGQHGWMIFTWLGWMWTLDCISCFKPLTWSLLARVNMDEFTWFWMWTLWFCLLQTHLCNCVWNHWHDHCWLGVNMDDFTRIGCELLISGWQISGKELGTGGSLIFFWNKGHTVRFLDFPFPKNQSPPRNLEPEVLNTFTYIRTTTPVV